MIVCCPECGTSIYCMESKPEIKIPTVIYDICKYCGGKGSITEHYHQTDSTDARYHSVSYTCHYCSGSGKGDIKGIIE